MATSTQQKQAVGSILAAGALWGCISIFVRQLSAGGLDALQICFVRTLFGSLIMLGFCLGKSPSLLKIALRDIWCFVGTGIISMALFNFFYFSAIAQGQASVAVVLLYTSPVFVMLLSSLMFKERITRRKLLALALCLGGCVLVAGVLGGAYQLSLHLFLYGIGAGFFYSLYSIFGVFALKKYDTITVTTYTFLFATAGLLPLANLGGIATAVRAQGSLLWWALGISVFCTVLPYLCYTWGLKQVEASKAAILVTIEPVVGALIGISLFGEPYNFTKLLGMGMIICVVLLLQSGGKSAAR